MGQYTDFYSRFFIKIRS